MDSSGNFVITWMGSGENSTADVYAQRYDVGGTAQGQEFGINDYTVDNQYEPSAAMDISGNFVIAWTSNGQDGSGPGRFCTAVFLFFCVRQFAAGIHPCCDDQSPAGTGVVNSTVATIADAETPPVS